MAVRLVPRSDWMGRNPQVSIVLHQPDALPTRLRSGTWCGQEIDLVGSTSRKAEVGYVVTYHFELRPSESRQFMASRPEPRWEGDFLCEAWDEGFAAQKAGLDDDSNPYEESGHERDSTPADECFYHWWSGWWAAYGEGK